MHFLPICWVSLNIFYYFIFTQRNISPSKSLLSQQAMHRMVKLRTRLIILNMNRRPLHY